MSLNTTPGDPNADSYTDVATTVAYAAAQGSNFPGTDVPGSEQALRRATKYIDTYRARFPGFRTNRRLQSLEWPRTGAYVLLPTGGDNSYFGTGAYFPTFDYIPIMSIPIEITNATCEAAVREFATPGVLLADIGATGTIKRYMAGGSLIEFGASTRDTDTYRTIDALLATLLLGGGGNRYTSAASRR